MKHICLTLDITKGNKLTAIFLALFMIISSISSAQRYGADSYKKFVGGLFGGFNSSQVDGDGYTGYSYIGWTAGGVVFLPFNNMNLPMEGTIAMSVEVAFSQKGSIGRTPSLGIYGQRVNLQYAEVPILVNYYRGTRKSSIGMGFSFGYLATQEEFVDYAGNGSFVPLQGYPFRKFDLSFLLSPNIHVYKGLYFSPRFQYSLMPIRENSGGIGNSDQFNNTLSFRLMYLFGKDQF